jgi:hypothetical protein
MEPTVGQTELCARYRCDPRTLRKHARGAGVFGRKSGRERVYPLSEVRRLDEYLAQRAGGGPGGGKNPLNHPSFSPPPPPPPPPRARTGSICVGCAPGARARRPSTRSISAG